MTPLEQAAIDAARALLDPCAAWAWDEDEPVEWQALRAALLALDAAPTQPGGARRGTICPHEDCVGCDESDPTQPTERSGT
jgi:hypothetical protein